MACHTGRAPTRWPGRKADSSAGRSAQRSPVVRRRPVGGGSQGREGDVPAVPHRPAPRRRPDPGCPRRLGYPRRLRRRVLLPRLRLSPAVPRGNGRLPHGHPHRHRPLLTHVSTLSRALPRGLSAVPTAVATAALLVPRPAPCMAVPRCRRRLPTRVRARPRLRPAAASGLWRRVAKSGLWPRVRREGLRPIRKPAVMTEATAELTRLTPAVPP